MFKKLIVTGAIGSVLAVLALKLLTLLPAAPALAQSGSRLCGWTAATANGGYRGLLIEIRQNDSDANKDCGDATNFLKYYYVDKDTENLTWTKQKMNTCENVGKFFMSANSPQDMCDKMEANKNYSVSLDKAANATNYIKLN